MSMLISEDLAQFRKLATKERDIVKASEGGWVGVYSALAMSLDRIAQLEAEVKAKNETTHRLQTDLDWWNLVQGPALDDQVKQLEAEVARLKEAIQESMNLPYEERKRILDGML